MIAELMVAAATAAGCHSDACQQRVIARDFADTDRVLRHRCNHDVDACITRAAHLHRVSAPWMHAIAWCESRMNPLASNGTHFGLFQYDWPTWYGGRYGRRGSPFSAKWASLQTAWYLRRGESSRWVCA